MRGVQEAPLGRLLLELLLVEDKGAFLDGGKWTHTSMFTSGSFLIRPPPRELRSLSEVLLYPIG